jgi:hypothetical protein
VFSLRLRPRRSFRHQGLRARKQDARFVATNRLYAGQRQREREPYFART